MLTKFNLGLVTLISTTLLLCSNASYGAQSHQLSHQDIPSVLKQRGSKTSADFATALMRQKLQQKSQHSPTSQSKSQRHQGDYQLKRQTSGNSKHVRYQQYFRQIPVWGHVQAVHYNQQQVVHRLNGDLATGIETDIGSVIPAINATDIAVTVQNKVHQDYGFNHQAKVSGQQVKLIVYLDDAHQAILAYYVEALYQQTANQQALNPQAQVASPAYIVDANTGVVLSHWNNLHQAEATGPGGNEKTGQYEFGVDYPALKVTQQDQQCSLENEQVRTIDYNNYDGPYDTYFDTFSFICPRNEHKVINGAFAPLNDAHFFAGATIDMF
ncbi:MAG: vibriolysin, partial [Phenylobacterium sp.]